MQAWAHVLEREKSLEDAKAKVVEQEQRIVDIQSKLDQCAVSSRAGQIGRVMHGVDDAD
jgi:hypothetical protein